MEAPDSPAGRKQVPQSDERPSWRPADLRGILRYIPHFREKVFILSIDGGVVTHENFSNLLLDVAVLRSLNIRVVIVHGASAQIRVLAAQLGLTPSDLDGTGITDEPTLRLALTAANRLTHEILEGLFANDLRAAYANVITAYPVGILGGVDHLYTGKVEGVDTEMLQSLLAQGIIPVLAPLGFDGEGKTYRVNSDSVALAVAEALRAIKLVFATTGDGILYRNKLVRQLIVGDLEGLLQRGRDEIPRPQLSKAEHAARACRAGVQRVHIINGLVDEGLLAEVFSNEGIGTLIYANEYQQIRRAVKRDIRSILSLTKKSMDMEELVRRSRGVIEKQLGDYYLFEIDRNPVACVALHFYPEQGKAEIAHLFVNPSHENQGIGKTLVSFLETKAREAGVRELFALSTQAFTYFQARLGFAEGSPNDLPPARREAYEQSGRRSKILVKKLSQETAR
jgi:amino-acid N-acetyltransferase